MHQNDLTGCDMRCSALESGSRHGDDEETNYCCSALSARAYGPVNGMVAGLAVLGEEESEHDLREGNLSAPYAVLEQEDDLVLVAEAVRASGR